MNYYKKQAIAIIKNSLILFRLRRQPKKFRLFKIKMLLELQNQKPLL